MNSSRLTPPDPSGSNLRKRSRSLGILYRGLVHKLVANFRDLHLVLSLSNILTLILGPAAAG